MSDPKMSVLTFRGERSAGSVTTFLRKWFRGLAAENVDVPCGACNACCRSPTTFVTNFTEDEKTRFADVIEEDDAFGLVMKKKPDGSCVFLIDNKCSIYSTRPRACRVYDCRASLLLGIVDGGGDPILKEALSQWSFFTMPLVEDREALTAIRMAILADGVPKNEADAMRKALRWKSFLPEARSFIDYVRQNGLK